jgi:hypothetical protein
VSRGAARAGQALGAVLLLGTLPALWALLAAVARGDYVGAALVAVGLVAVGQLGLACWGADAERS